MKSFLRTLAVGLVLTFIAGAAESALAACGPPGNLGALRNQFRVLINAERQGRGLAALTADASLQAASQKYGCVMANTNRFDHIGKDGSNPGARARASGYAWCLIAENIALGQTNAKQAFTDWMNSPGHRANMLQKDIRNLGLGVGVKTGGQWYWALLVGKKC